MKRSKIKTAGEAMGNSPLSENAIKVLKERYFIKDKDGDITEDWEGLCWRVANAVAKDEKTKAKQKEWAQKYFDIMYNLYFLPNTPTLINAGKEKGQMAACFVLPIEDSIDSIFEAIKQAAIIHKSGGGTGFSFSRIRPHNSIVRSTSGVASGPVSFMKVFNSATEEIRQGGVRRGANMGILICDHPDIMEFIDCKQDLSQFTNFNISVALTDNFMRAVKSGREYELTWGGKSYGKLKAREVFDKICKNAWAAGEPGIFFIDTVNKTNGYGEIFAANPCAEQPLRDNEACTLGSINLNKYVENSKFNEELYEEHVFVATRFLDSVVSVNCYPIEIIEKTHKETRKIGLGVMGLSDMFIKLGLQYGSKKSYKIAEEVYYNLNYYSKMCSLALGGEKGSCIASIEENEVHRNYWTTTNAPTGTISLIAGCSSGIEPIYAIGFFRNILDGKGFAEFNQLFSDTCEEYGFKITEELKEKICSSLSIQKIKEIPEKIREVFVTAFDVSPEGHVHMQSIIQKNCDSGVSKTVNMPNSAKVEDVAEVYMQAYEKGCKGITVYRDGSRENQVLSVKKEEPNRKVYNRTAVMSGTTEKISTSFGSLYLTLNNHSHGEPGEIILNIGKSGAETKVWSEALGRMISIALQHGISASKLGHHLKGIKGEDIIHHRGSMYLSIPDLIGRKILEHAKEKEKEKSEAVLAPCPSCDARVYRGEGCLTCIACGWSKC